MFQQLKNIDTAFKHIRLFSLVLILACVVICCYAIFKSHAMVSQAHERIYILANAKALEAYSAGRKDNIPVEARDHVKMFHYYFFTLDPDDEVIQKNINKALYLADESAKKQYDNLKESRFYSNIISGNISQDIEVDSVTDRHRSISLLFQVLFKTTDNSCHFHCDPKPGNGRLFEKCRQVGQ